MLTDTNQKEETGQARKRRMDNSHKDSPSKKLRGKQAEISNQQVTEVQSGTVKHASTGVGGQISSFHPTTQNKGLFLDRKRTVCSNPSLPSEKGTVQSKIDSIEKNTTKIASKSAPKVKKNPS